MTENKTRVNTSQELPRWIQTLAKRNELQRGNRERGRAFYVQTIVIFLATPAGSRLLTRRPAPACSLATRRPHPTQSPVTPSHSQISFFFFSAFPFSLCPQPPPSDAYALKSWKK